MVARPSRSHLPARKFPPVRKRRARLTAESLLWGRLTVALESHLSANLSRLQNASVSPSTARQYVFHLSLFFTWWRTVSPLLLLKTRTQIDRALTLCFGDLFNDGHNASTGNNICAALLHPVPHHGGRSTWPSPERPDRCEVGSDSARRASASRCPP